MDLAESLPKFYVYLTQTNRTGSRDPDNISNDTDDSAGGVDEAPDGADDDDPDGADEAEDGGYDDNADGPDDDDN